MSRNNTNLTGRTETDNLPWGDEGGTKDEAPMWRRNEVRYAELRAQYVNRVCDLRQKQAETLAWSELGYSSSGIAKRIDQTESTVRGHIDAISETVAKEAAWACTPDELGIKADIGGGAQ